MYSVLEVFSGKKYPYPSVSTRIHPNPSVAFRSLPWSLAGVVSLYHNQKTKVYNHKKQNYHGIKVCSK